MRYALALFTCACCPILGFAQEKKESVSILPGYWAGELKVGPTSLRMGFQFKAKGDGFAGVLDSPDQGGFGIAIDEVRFKNESLELDLTSLGAKLVGSLDKDGRGFDAVLHQSGMKLPIALKKLDARPEYRRSQDPKKPYPYNEEEVAFENALAKVTLVGTVTWPKGKGPFPAAILISGSGPQDRNETIAGHRPFLVLADHLTKAGFAVLRFDDRGVGKSTGKFWEATSADHATDVEAALEFLRNRPNIDASRIGFIGHSEGGLIAPLVAQEDPELAFIILLAGPGVTGQEIVETQLRILSKNAGISDEVATWNRALQRKVAALLKEELDDEKAKARIKVIVDHALDELEKIDGKSVKTTRALVDLQLAPLMFRWSRFFLNHDPRPVLKKIACPVLAIVGEKDVQVDAGVNLREIRKALLEGNAKDITLKQFDGMNHLFQRSKTGAIAEYGVLKTTIEPEVLDFVCGWLQVRFADKAAK